MKTKDPVRQAVGKKSRRKGAGGEREAAEVLTKLLKAPFFRVHQTKGTPDTPDVAVKLGEDGETSSLSDLYIEVKRGEHLDMPAIINKALKDCGPLTPIIIHRKNHGKWLCTFVYPESTARIISDHFDKIGEMLPLPSECSLNSSTRTKWGKSLYTRYQEAEDSLKLERPGVWPILRIIEEGCTLPLVVVSLDNLLNFVSSYKEMSNGFEDYRQGKG